MYLHLSGDTQTATTSLSGDAYVPHEIISITCCCYSARMNTVDMVSVGDVAAALTPNLDGDDAPPFKDEVTSFQVLIGGAAELNVHLLNEIKKKHIFSIDLNR